MYKSFDKLKATIAAILLLLFVSSCNQFWITGILKDADEADIQLYGISDTANTKPISIITITDKAELAKIEGFVSNDEIENNKKCGYDGTIKFKNSGQVLIDTEFKLQPGCKSISFILNNSLHCRKLTDEGYQYLSAINTRENIH